MVINTDQLLNNSTWKHTMYRYQWNLII